MIEQGIHDGIAPSRYHAWAFRPGKTSGPISCSVLKRYANLGPLAFRWAPERSGTRAMSWGSLVDCLLFTPELFPREFVCKEQNPFLSEDGGVRSKEAKQWAAERREEGAVFIKEEDRDHALQAVERLRNTPVAAEILEGARFQIALSYTGQAEIPVKCLVDIVPEHFDHDDCLADLKTTAVNIHDDDALARQVGKFGYHWQAAMYLFTWNQLSADKRRRWKIVWQSANPPYEVRVTELDSLWLDQGRAAVMAHMARLVRDIKTDTWRSPFQDAETTLDLHTPTQWAEERALEILEEIEK